MKCPFCGRDVLPGAKFCTGCGQALPVAEPTPAPQDQAQQAPINQPQAQQTPINQPQVQQAPNNQPPMGYPQQPPMGYPQQPPMGYPQQPPMGYPQQQGYPPYGATQMPQPKVPGKGLGIAGMVLGIVSLVFACWIPFVSVILGIVGLVLSAIGLSKAKKANMKNGMALAGFVCSCITVGISVIFMIILGGAIGSVFSML